MDSYRNIHREDKGKKYFSTENTINACKE